MKDWEFLIQKAGDRHWYSLESKLGSLTVGNYRMVARTPYTNQTCSLKMTYQGSTEQSPIVLLQASRQTNGEGFVMVFSYRDLLAGHWQLFFTDQSSDDSTGSGEEFWEKAIAFQVADPLIPVEQIPEKDPEISLAPSTLALSAPEPSCGEPTALADVDLSLTMPLESSLPSPFPLSITLDRNEFSELGEAFLILAGQVEAVTLDQPLSFPARLRYRLQDLDSAAYLLNEPKSWLPILGEALPFSFKETLVLPPTEATDLLGELLIETQTGEILAQVLFNLTLSPRSEAAIEEEAVNYTIQLSNLENHSSFTFEVIVPKEAAETPLNVDLPNPAKMNRLLKRSLLLERPVLPPKIEPILAPSLPKKSLRLPKISPSQP